MLDALKVTFTSVLLSMLAVTPVSSGQLADETHNSVFPRAFSNGLRFVFGSR